MFNACLSAPLVTASHWTQGNGTALGFRLWPHPSSLLPRIHRTAKASWVFSSLTGLMWLAVKIQQKPLPKHCGAAPAEPGEHLQGEGLLWARGTTAALSKLGLALSWELRLVMWPQEQEGSTQWHWWLPIPKNSKDTNNWPRVSECWCMQACQGEQNRVRVLSADLSTVWRAWTSADHKFSSHMNRQGLLLILLPEVKMHRIDPLPTHFFTKQIESSFVKLPVNFPNTSATGLQGLQPRWVAAILSEIYY